MLAYKNLFSPNDYENNDNIILKFFQYLKRWKNYIVLFVASNRKVEKPKISYLLVKTLVLYIICSKCKNEDEKLFNEESTQILRILGLIENI